MYSSIQKFWDLKFDFWYLKIVEKIITFFIFNLQLNERLLVSHNLLVANM